MLQAFIPDLNGLFAGTARITAASHNNSPTSTSATSMSAYSGQVNNFAMAALNMRGGAGTFSQFGSTYTLDFGTRSQGSGILNATLLARNAALGPAELLDGSYIVADAKDFGETEFDPFADLAAGQSTVALFSAFDTASLGFFSDSVVLHGISHNESGFSAAVGDITLLVRGTVIESRVSAVPEPPTLLLFLLAPRCYLLRIPLSDAAGSCAS